MRFSIAYSQKESVIDSLNALLSKSDDDTNKVMLLNRLYYEYKNLDPNKALTCVREGELLATRLNFKKGKALCLDKIGRLYCDLGEYENALANYFKAFKINEAIRNKKGISDNLCNIGITYRTLQNYEKALEYQFKGLKMDENLQNKSAIAEDNVNIGNTYFDAENYKEAMTYYNKALKYFVEISNKKNTASVLNNIGAVYFNGNNFQFAVEYFNRAINIFEAEGDKEGVAMDLNNIGEVYAAQKKYEKALEYYKKSLTLSAEIGAKSLLQANYNGLSEISAQMNNYKAAFEYHKLYFDITNSLMNSETNSRINELAIKYETEKKEKENALLKQENIKQSFLNHNQKAVTNYLIMGLIIVSLIGFTFFGRSRRKEKEKENLEKIVSERTAELNFKNKQKELMLQEIHHRVKNNLQVISSLLRLQTHYKGEKDVDEILNNCIDRIKCMAILHDKLCQANDYSEINLQEYFSELISYVSKNYDNVSPNTKIELDITPLTLHINKLIPCGLIINELVSNVYKYAFDKNSLDNLIQISFSKNDSDNTYHLTIRDNGKGYPENFDIDKQAGLGMVIVQSLVEQLDGILSIEKNKGTIINISFQ
jgi:two-component sensor histidine kinase/predicted negative regulator of RcsB-dependent stress response